MDIKFRHYTTADFELVSDFLIANHRPGNQDGNWLQPAWEYMHSHPAIGGSHAGPDRDLGTSGGNCWRGAL